MAKKEQLIGLFSFYPKYRLDFITTANQLNAIVYLPIGTNSDFLKEYGIKVRYFKVVNKNKFRNKFFYLLFFLFGKLPKNRKYYYINTKIKNDSIRGLLKKTKSQINYFLELISPKFFSYDSYLSLLKFECEIDLSDVETLILDSNINDSFFSFLMTKKRKIYIYLYSWDHPAKFRNLPKNVDGYFVWNNNLKFDLLKLNGICDTKIHEIGSLFLCDLYEFKSQQLSTTLDQNIFGNKKFFYCCLAFGYPNLAETELKYFSKISVLLENNYPEINLVIRPYPFHNEESLELLSIKHKNIIIDNRNIFNEKKSDTYNKILQSLGFIHLGTTLGLEASHLNIPIIYICFEIDKNKALSNVLAQYHLNKYFRKPEFQNVIDLEGKLEPALARIIKNADNQILDYNNSVNEMFPLRSKSQIIEAIENVIN